MVFAGLAVLTLALAMRDNWRALKTLLSRPLLLFGAWVLVTVGLSLDRHLAAPPGFLDGVRHGCDSGVDAVAEIAE